MCYFYGAVPKTITKRQINEENEMSKSALKALANADAMIKTAGIMNAAPLVEFLNDGKKRTVGNKKLWRNADVLASLLICAAADCLQTETPETEAVTAARRAFPDLNERVISRCLADAMSWANNLEREND